MNVNEMIVTLRNHSNTITRIKNEMPRYTYQNAERMTGHSIDTIQQGLNMAIIILEQIHGDLPQNKLKELEEKVNDISYFAELILKHLDK